MADRTIGGRCQCGAVRLELNGPILESGYCHCSLCRRQSGSAFAAYGEIASEQVRLVDDEEKLARYDITERLSKWFCSVCGTTLYDLHSAFPGYHYVSLGILDDDADVSPAFHQFLSSKATWYRFSDDLRRHDGWSDDEPAS